MNQEDVYELNSQQWVVVAFPLRSSQRFSLFTGVYSQVQFNCNCVERSALNVNHIEGWWMVVAVLRVREGECDDEP